MKKIKQKYSLCILICISCLFTWSCSSPKKANILSPKKVNMSMKKTKDISTGKSKYIISAPVVFKRFVKKNGELTKRQDIYIQRSIQDYFIKFCESKISREDLENHLSTMGGEIKTATLEIEFLDGDWDACDDNFEQQSRVGEYVIIHRIVK